MINQISFQSFAHVDTWVFDLDNTLYPPTTDFFSQVSCRMTDYICDFLKLDYAPAYKLQKDFYRDYGMTLKGLMENYSVDPEDFLDRVHDIDYSFLTADPALNETISQLPGQKFIFTNGNYNHAEKTAARLNILDNFDGIFDIKAANYVPKPHRETYERFLAHFQINPQNAAMFEDLAHNLIEPNTMGMQTVLIAPRNGQETYSEFWQQDIHNQPHIDFVTENLKTFLQQLNLQLYQNPKTGE